MARDFTFTMQRVYNRPLAITPERAAFVLAIMRDRFALKALQDDAGRYYDKQGLERLAGGNRMDNFQMRGWDTPELTRSKTGVAVIEVDGILVKKNGMNPYCGMTGYDGIEAKVRAALDDDDVKAIWFDVNSGGGEVSGCFGLCDFIYENRASNGGKMMVAMAADDAYSAAYAIASSADIVAVPPSGGVGSIGVLVVHVEESKALEMEGITATIIRSGKHKAEFNSIEPLKDDVRARVQDEIDVVRDQFVDLVARNRGLSTETVFKTEALTYMGADARAIGLVNEVISEQEMFARLTKAIG
jgi:signal peptide peptidase SppA